ncbi:TPA: ESPR domain-containing protein, partial [Burkholderia multivorans]|nr:ESPR domain-containing protein [Burkholderia multivorans]HDR9376533.1 ESPR domain-containing protein [Burkholderia multivorans]
MNHSFRSIWSDTSGCWIAVAETTRARGKQARSATDRAGRLARRVAGRSPLRIAALATALAALAAGNAYASSCGDGTSVASGGSCALGTFSPTV